MSKMAARKNEEMTLGLPHSDPNLLTTWSQIGDNIDSNDINRTKSNAELNSGVFNDTSVTDLIIILDEVKIHSAKVEAVNIQLKQDRQRLQKQIAVLQKELAINKRRYEDELSAKSSENQKLKEEISNSFQENCSLKESTAHISLENTRLKHEISNVKLENSKLLKKVTQLQGEQKGCNSSKGQKNNLEEISRSFFMELMKEKQELEQKNNQTVDVRKDGGSNNSSSDFSLLGFDLSDEIQLKEINNCIQNVTGLKQELKFNNFTLKFLFHMLFSKQQKSEFLQRGNHHFTQSCPPAVDFKQEIIKCKKLNENSFSTKVKTSESFDAGNDKKLNQPEEDLDIESDGISSHINNRNQPPQLTEHKLHLFPSEHSSNSCFGKGYYQEILYPPPLIINENILSKHSQSSHEIITKQNVAGLSPVLTELSDDFPLLRRSESSEVNVGSPPHSNLLLTPDSLLGEAASPLSPTKNPNFPNSSYHAASQATDVDEDRICPMCQISFPKPVPQKEFENHVVGHFDVEEFELLHL